MAENLEEVGVVVPHRELAAETLRELVVQFILRNGTDYGAQEVALDTKVEQILRQLDSGKVQVVFDLTSETASIVPVLR